MMMNMLLSTTSWRRSSSSSFRRVIAPSAATTTSSRRMRVSLCFFVVVALLLCVVPFTMTAEAFVSPPQSSPRPPFRLGVSFKGGNTNNGDRNNNNNQQPPRGPPSDSFGGGFEEDGSSSSSSSILSKVPLEDEWNQNVTSTHLLSQRGGGAAVSKKKKDEPVAATVVSYWKGALSSVAANLVRPFRLAQKQASLLFKSKQQKETEALLEQLQNMPVRRVVVPNSTVLPPDVVQIAAKRAGLLGQPLRSDRVQDLAQAIKRWYVAKGYVLHAVTGATLKSDTATAEIAVQEPWNSQTPVGITFYREMVIDPDTGELLTFRQYKERHKEAELSTSSLEPTRRKSRFRSSSAQSTGASSINRADLNTTLVPTQGRTRPHRIAQALRLQPGQPFCWDSQRWQQLAASGVFAQVFEATPVLAPTGDGVQLHISATEAPARHLEYGLGKSLYTGGWEGELEFTHRNVWGGGEALGVTVRQGARDAEPSVHLKFRDGRLGVGGGYDVQAFSEYIGDDAAEESGSNAATATATTATASSSKVASTTTSTYSYDQDMLKNRRGLTVQVQNPIDPRTVQHSAARVSLERTATQTGLHESIGSTTLQVGPFLRKLPLGARSNFDGAVTVGTRLAREENAMTNDGDNGDDVIMSSSPYSTHVKPYVSIAGTTRQLFPLLGSSQPRPLLLALRHSATASTHGLPRHVAKAIGTNFNIRGTAPNGRVASAVTGTAEIRLPIQLPQRLLRRAGGGGGGGSAAQQQQDLSAVLYGDWLVASRDAASPLVRKSCVGLGLRKRVQGIPLQYDLTYSAESGKLKTTFGLGSDFVF